MFGQEFSQRYLWSSIMAHKRHLFLHMLEDSVDIMQQIVELIGI